MQYVGICGTDLQIFDGTRPDTASVLGHEGVGVVMSAGIGAEFSVGDSVVFNPVAQIGSGRLLGHNVDGLFQQYFAVDAPAVQSGLVLPAEGLTPPICGALIEPLGSVIYSHELISRRIPRWRTAVVFGAGPIGLTAALLLKSRGIRVLLVHPHGPRLKLATEMNVVSPDDARLACESAELRARNGGNGFDAALICTNRSGARAALQVGVDVVRAGGCIDLMTNYPEIERAPVGLDTDAIRAVRAANVCGVPAEGAYLDASVSGRTITLTGHRGTSSGHLKMAMDELRASGQAYARLITHVLTLREAEAAIPILCSSRTRSLFGRDCIKAVIDLTTTGSELSAGGFHGPRPGLLDS